MQIVDDNLTLTKYSERKEPRVSTSEWRWYHLLPVGAAAIYTFTPILSMKFGVPGAVKFLGDLVVMVMIVLAFGRMFISGHMRSRVPGAFLAIIALTVIGSIVAAFEGQSSNVTIYGWWMMFRFPMVGLFVYLVPDWPKNVAAWIPKVMLYLFGFQVFVQILLFLMGSRDYDSLAGTFGYKGVGAFINFIFIVLALALGKWLVKGTWNMLIITLALGVIASAIGEMKLVMVAAPLMAILALIFHILKGAEFRKALLFVGFLAIAIVGFLITYDVIIVKGLGKPPLESFLDPEKRDRYFDFARDSGVSYRLGRNSEIEYGWQLIQRDTPTFLFGHGLGTRQYSPDLGLVGTGLRDGLYRLFVGRSFLVLSYEMGLIGLLVIAIFIVLTVILLYRANTRSNDLDMNVIRVGLILYTLFWPVWIWYQAIWIMAAPSIMYWMLWGYAMHYTVGASKQQLPEQR